MPMLFNFVHFALHADIDNFARRITGRAKVMHSSFGENIQLGRTLITDSASSWRWGKPGVFRLHITSFSEAATGKN